MPSTNRPLNIYFTLPLQRGIWLAALSLGFLCSCAKTDKVVIYATARTNGWLWERPVKGEKGEIGGYAVFKRVYDQEKHPHLAVDLGNWFKETPEGYITKGAAVIDCMNSIPYAAAALGPEDLALAPEDLEKLVKGSSCPVLGSNLYLNTNKKPPFMKSHYIIKTGKTAIGLLAINIMNPEKANNPAYLANYKFEKVSYEIERALKALKDGNAKFNVLLLGINPQKSTEKGFYQQLLAKLPRIDLVITDDPAVKKRIRVHKSWIVPVPAKLLSASRIELSIDPETGRLTKVSSRPILLETRTYGQDQATLNVVKKQRENLRKHFGRKIGSAAEEIKKGEGTFSPIGNFTADCVKRWARSNGAIVNNSILAGGLDQGPVTIGDLYRVLPTDTSVVFVKIRGEDLMQAIEESMPKDISVSGMQVFMKGDRVDKLLIEGYPANPNHIYRIAVPDSIVSDKDHSLLSSATEFANSRRFLREVMSWCFSRQAVTPKPYMERVIKSE